MWSYNFLCIVLGGVRMSLYMLQNCVYGWGVSMCRSGGFGSMVIVCRSCNVQSGVGGRCRYVLHVSIDGLIVTISA
jgi:hypothetical protein